MSGFSNGPKQHEQPPEIGSSKRPLPGNSAEPIAGHFDQVTADYADAYLHLNSPPAFFFQRRQAIVIPFLRHLKRGLILDIGCGPGNYAKPVTDQGYHYFGLDISPEMISEARRRFTHLENADFSVGDAAHLPFASESVDGLLCLGMLEYVPREREAAYLNEMVRVLKPGGIIILSFLNARSPYWIWVDDFFPTFSFIWKNVRALVTNANWISFRECLGENLPTRKFRLKERLALLQAMTLSTIGISYFALNILPPPLDARFARQSVWASVKLEHLLQKPAFQWAGMAFVIAARKAENPREKGSS